MESKPTVKKKKSTDLMIQNIIIKSPSRKSVDIAVWRSALQSAEKYKRVPLYDLYEDLLLDNILSAAIGKRIMAITNSNVIFRKNDQPVPEMDALIDSQAFEKLITEIMMSKFWGITLLEFDFTNGFEVFSIPRKHIRPDTGMILINQTDETGIPYQDDPFFLQIGSKDDLGLILKTSPFVIYKRGSFGDWAQFAELFGMPFRIGYYNAFDDQTRRALENALEKSGGAPWAVVPKEGDIKYMENSSSGTGGVFDLLKNACNQEILISILGQTMTTIDGSSKSQSETHKESEEQLNKSDRRFVQRILNSRLIPILEARGYPVKDGLFFFPEADEDISLTERVEIDIKLSDIVDIPAGYFYETYGIPRPGKGDEIARRKSASDPSPGEPPPDPNFASGDNPKGVIRKLFSFFLKTPAAGLTDTCPVCGGSAQPLISLSSTTDEMWKIVRQIAHDVYNHKIPVQQTDADLALATGDALMTALKETFPKFSSLTPDDTARIQWINRQQNNIYKFGIAKSYSQLKQMRDRVIDPGTGKIRPYTEFLKEVISVHEKYNKTWLETEYGAVVRGTVMGSKWMDIVDQQDAAPYLQYVTAGDSRVREAHQALDGIIEPVDSTFWNQYLPQNGWRCRCSVRQLSDREAEHKGYQSGNTDKNSKIAGKVVKDRYWRKNVGKTTIIEAEGTAYIETIPGKGKTQLSAVDHYGMMPVKEIYDKFEFKQPQALSKEELTRFLEEKNYGSADIGKLPVRFDSSFADHMEKSGHLNVAGEIENVLKSPHEVWWEYKSSGRFKGEYFKVYLRYYDPFPVVLLLDENGIANTMYELSGDPGKPFKQSYIENFRRGTLILKQKPG